MKPQSHPAPDATLADRRNGRVFTTCITLNYLAAPVIYIDVVQAALCDKLGASPTVASLPASTYLFGNLAPFFFSWLVPHRLERRVAVVGYAATAALLAAVFLLLILPVSDGVRIPPGLGQGFFQGLSSSGAVLFLWQFPPRGPPAGGGRPTRELTQ